jgi:hypothetical protein
MVPLLMGLTSTAARAQGAIGPHIGINFDANDIFIGGQAHAPVATIGSNPIYVNPRLDFYLKDNVTLIGINANGYYQFGSNKKDVTFHAGGGLALLWLNSEGANDTDLGLNLLGGLKFRFVGIQWVSQLEVTIGSGNDFELLVGPTFAL